MVVDSHVITVREFNKSLIAILGIFFSIGLAIATWYVTFNNNRLDNLVEGQNQTNIKIESFSIKTELNDLKLMKLENRADAFSVRQNEFDKELSQSKLILKNHDQLLIQHEKQIKALEKQ